MSPVRLRDRASVQTRSATGRSQGRSIRNVNLHNSSGAALDDADGLSQEGSPSPRVEGEGEPWPNAEGTQIGTTTADNTEARSRRISGKLSWMRGARACQTADHEDFAQRLRDRLLAVAILPQVRGISADYMGLGWCSELFGFKVKVWVHVGQWVGLLIFLFLRFRDDGVWSLCVFRVFCGWGRLWQAATPWKSFRGSASVQFAVCCLQLWREEKLTWCSRLRALFGRVLGAPGPCSSCPLMCLSYRRGLGHAPQRPATAAELSARRQRRPHRSCRLSERERPAGTMWCRL